MSGRVGHDESWPRPYHADQARPGQDSSVLVTISDLFQMLYLRGDVSSTPLEAVNEAGVDVVWSPAAGQGPELDQCVVI